MVKEGISGFTNVDYKSKGLSNEALLWRCKCCPPPPQGQGEGRCLCGSSAARSEDCCVQPAQECQEVLLGDVSHGACFCHDFLRLDFVDLGVEKLWVVDAGLRTCTCTTTRDLGCFFVASKLEMFVWKLV